MTNEGESYQTQLTAEALRSLQSIPPRIAEPLLAFIFGSLSDNPRRRGKPLQWELTGYWGARRGDYRVIYQLDEESKTMSVIKVAHRSNAYRTR